MNNLKEPNLTFWANEMTNPFSTNPKHIIQITYERNQLKVYTNIKDWYCVDFAETKMFESLLQQPNYYTEFKCKLNELREWNALINSSKRN